MGLGQLSNPHGVKGDSKGVLLRYNGLFALRTGSCSVNIV